MRIAVVAEYYPRPGHPGWGIWAHRQALAVHELNVEVRVLALHRPLPPLYALRSLAPRGGGPDMRPLRDWVIGLRAQRRADLLDGVPVRYVRFLAPPRPTSYASWGRWAARPLGRALDALYREWPFDLIHAHYAVPAGDAALRWIEPGRIGLPLVVSVHGGDLSYTAARFEGGRGVVASTLSRAAAVIANSSLTQHRIEELTGPLERLTVVHPGADLPAAALERRADPTLVTVGHLESHKNQESVIRALAALRGRHPTLRYVLIGKGPDRAPLEQLVDSLGLAGRVEFLGAMPHEQALRELASCHVHAMPSAHDAFGVAHIEAMAAGLPTIGGAGTGAIDIAQAGEGMLLVPAGDASALVRAIDRLVSDRDECRRLGEAARRTVAEHFSWERCGRRTERVYQEAAGG